MKKLIYTLLLLASTATSILAQPLTDNKRDYIWLFGELNQLYNAGDTSYGGAYMDFKTNPPLLYKQPKRMDFSIASSSLADSLGNLWAYTNGISIADRTHQTMMNGDSIGWTDFFWSYYYNRGMAKEQLPIFILRQKLAYLINPVALGGQIGIPGTGFAKLEYSIVDISFNNGRGRVINKNIQPFSDSLTTAPGTCRHSNGLDWWLIQPSQGNKYNTFLIDSSGLNLKQVSIFNASNLQNGQSFFSPNGEHYIVLDYHTWLIQNNPDTKFLIYDFDRCTGQLSNEKIIYPPGGLLCMGTEVSPNSKYLYLINFNFVLQYDITLPTAAEIAASVDTVAVYDGFKHLGQYETKFFLPQNAPDGKIYMSTWGENRYMHVIEDPNEKGMACHVRQHELWLPSWSEMTMPNFPNYRLGAIDGSACDTLGIDQQTFPLLRLKPYKVNFGEVEIGQTYSRTIKAYNLGTGTVLPTTFTTQTGDYSLTLPTAIPVGDSTTLTLTYTPSTASIGAKDTLRIESNSQIPTNLIFARADVNTATEDIDSNTPSILVYPNPAQESITLSYELAQDGEAELVNSLGQVLATHALQAGYHKTWFSVADVPNGAYFIRVSTSAGVQISKQVFVLH